MPQPTASDGHIDAPLTNISVAYIQNQTDFVATQAFPMVSVEKQSDKYFVFDKNDWFTDEMRRRGESEESAGSGYNLSTDSYNATVWALHKDVSNRARLNSDNPLNPDRNAVQWLTQKALLRQEMDWVSKYFTPGVWGTDSTPANLWSDATLSTPLQDIDAAKRIIKLSTGFTPNTLVLGYDVFDQLKNHPDLVDRFKYTTSDSLTLNLIGSLFGIPRVLIASAVLATNNEGGTPTYDFTHGKHALLCYAALSPSLETPSAGYTFTWRGISQGLGADTGITRIDMPLKKSTRIEIEAAWDNKVVAPDLGFLFENVVS